MTVPIELDYDVYGTYARACAIADWLELAAITGVSKSRADLEDIVADNEWTRTKPRAFQIADHPEDLPPEDWASAVIAMLAERADILGPRWPFELLESGRVKFIPPKRPRPRRVAGRITINPYIAVLAISAAHAWGIPTADDPKRVLEGTAVRALRSKGLLVSALGTADRKGNGFAATLKTSSKELSLRAQVMPSPSHISAQDAGADTVVKVGWHDLRPAGQWLKLGQVTTAQSNEWQKKLAEPISGADSWRRFYMESLLPAPFLVIPHHVGRDHLRVLVTASTGLVIDRLRLVLDLEDTSPAERRIVRAVLAAGVARL